MYYDYHQSYYNIIYNIITMPQLRVVCTLYRFSTITEIYTFSFPIQQSNNIFKHKQACILHATLIKSHDIKFFTHTSDVLSVTNNGWVRKTKVFGVQIKVSGHISKSKSVSFIIHIYVQSWRIKCICLYVFWHRSIR